MDLSAVLPLCMFATLLALLMLGFPVAFTIAGTAVFYGAYATLTEVSFVLVVAASRFPKLAFSMLGVIVAIAAALAWAMLSSMVSGPVAAPATNTPGRLVWPMAL